MKNEFLKYCSNNEFQQNEEQIKTLDLVISFYKQSSTSNNKFFKFFTKTDKKLGFYLQGDVGVGKTMLLNFFFRSFGYPKTTNAFQ